MLLKDGGRGAKRSLLLIICHTYLTMIKLGTVITYLKEIQKIYESRDIRSGLGSSSIIKDWHLLWP